LQDDLLTRPGGFGRLVASCGTQVRGASGDTGIKKSEKAGGEGVRIGEREQRVDARGKERVPRGGEPRTCGVVVTLKRKEIQKESKRERGIFATTSL